LLSQSVNRPLPSLIVEICPHAGGAHDLHRHPNPNRVQDQ
jgi:hypothetical protein